MREKHENVMAVNILVNFDLDFGMLFIAKYLIRSDRFNFGFVLELVPKIKLVPVGTRVTVVTDYGERFVAERTGKDSAVMITECCVFQSDKILSEKVKDLMTTIFKLSLKKKYKENRESSSRVCSLFGKLLDLYTKEDLTAWDISTVRR